MDASVFDHRSASPSLFESCLARAFPGSRIRLQDDGALHEGHPGRPAGFGHLSLEIVAGQFTGRSLLERHRMIHRALGSLADWQVHALAISARAPGEDLLSSSRPSHTSSPKEVTP
jgi:BolA protein